MKLHLDVARWFLLVAAPVGIVLVFLIPPFQVTDEIAHYYRSYQVAEGDWLPTELGGQLPRSLRLTADEQAVGELVFHPERRASRARVMAGFQRQFEEGEPREMLGFNSALYSPIVYLPQALGSFIGRILGAGPLALLYWQRLFNTLGCLALLFVALRLAAAQSFSLFAIAMSPMSLFLRSSVSADPMTFALALLFVAVLSREMKESGPISPRRLMIFAALIAALGLCKSVYFPIAGGLLCLPSSRFGDSVRKKLLVVAGVCLAALLPSLLWSASVAHLVAGPSGAVDSHLQLAHLREHPVTGVATLVGAWWQNSYFYSRTMMGVLGWLDTPIPDWVNGMLWLMLAQLTLMGDSVLNRTGRVWMLVLVGVSAMGVIAAMYVTWTPVAATYVDGVQGRYFLPLMPAVLMALGTRWFQEPRLARVLTGAFAVLSVSATIYAVAMRYWGPV